jgi:hypothetical protein
VRSLAERPRPPHEWGSMRLRTLLSVSWRQKVVRSAGSVDVAEPVGLRFGSGPDLIVCLDRPELSPDGAHRVVPVRYRLSTSAKASCFFCFGRAACVLAGGGWWLPFAGARSPANQACQGAAMQDDGSACRRCHCPSGGCCLSRAMPRCIRTRIFAPKSAPGKPSPSPRRHAALPAERRPRQNKHPGHALASFCALSARPMQVWHRKCLDCDMDFAAGDEFGVVLVSRTLALTRAAAPRCILDLSRRGALLNTLAGNWRRQALAVQRSLLNSSAGSAASLPPYSLPSEPSIQRGLCVALGLGASTAAMSTCVFTCRACDISCGDGGGRPMIVNADAIAAGSPGLSSSAPPSSRTRRWSRVLRLSQARTHLQESQ